MCSGLIPIVVYVRIPLCGWVTLCYVGIPHPVCSFQLGGRLGFCYCLAITNHAAIDIGMPVLGMCFLSLGRYVGMGLQGHMIILCFTFWETDNFPKVAVHHFVKMIFKTWKKKKKRWETIRCYKANIFHLLYCITTQYISHIMKLM